MAEEAVVERSDGRAPLSRDRVIQAALSLADAEGIDALTMRRLAGELGVEAMSLYHYVRSKDELLAGILDLALAEIDLPTVAGDWKAALREGAISTHDALVRHPWAAALEASSIGPRPARLRFMEWALGGLREAGFPAGLTDLAYHTLDSHITGFTLWQVNLPFTTQEELVELGTRFLESLPPDLFPRVVEHVHHHLQPTAAEGRGTFAFGLDLILDGFERHLVAD